MLVLSYVTRTQDTQGGALIYAGNLSAVTDAIVNFDANNADPKAAMLASYTFVALTVKFALSGAYGVPSDVRPCVRSRPWFSYSTTAPRPQVEHLTSFW